MADEAKALEGRSTALRGLQRRLSFELPISPSADNIAAISNDYSLLETRMLKEWEDMERDRSSVKKCGLSQAE